MPGYKTHLAGAWIAAIFPLFMISAYILPQSRSLYLAALLGITFGTLFPDIDITSKGQKIFFILIASLILVSIITKNPFFGACIGFLGCIPLLSSHRGPFHSPIVVTAVIASTALFLLKKIKYAHYLIIIFALSFWYGAMVHLILDSRFFKNLKHRKKKK